MIALATFIALFYAEEDWRGARNLRAAIVSYTSAGKSLDQEKFVPPAIRDAENLASLPLFVQSWAKPIQPSPDEPTGPYLHPVALEKALRQDESYPGLPTLGNYLTGKPADLIKTRQRVARIYQTIFKNKPLPATSLLQLDEIFPVIEEVRTATVSRPLCRFNVDYIPSPSGNIPVALLTDQIPVARLLALHGELALDNQQPDLAMGDLQTIYILASGEDKYPGLIGHLIGIALRAIGGAIVMEGLSQHAWNDQQLEQMQTQFFTGDCLRNFGMMAQSETAFSISTFELMKVRFSVGHTWQYPNPNSNKVNRILNPFSPWPAGWMDENEAQLLEFQIKLQATVDLELHRVYVDRDKALSDSGKDKKQTQFVAPWDLLFRPAAGAYQHAASKFARSAVLVDHLILACGLERYRLKHGAYPKTLATLVPDYCPSIPHDVINGQPYLYKVKEDGSYLLYSVGWNEKDDGGVIAYKSDDYQRTQIDFDQGDWVWFGAR